MLAGLAEIIFSFFVKCFCLLLITLWQMRNQCESESPAFQRASRTRPNTCASACAYEHINSTSLTHLCARQWFFVVAVGCVGCGRDAFAQRLFKNATIIFRLFVSFLCSLSGFFFRVHLSFVCCNFSDNFNCRRPRCTTYGHSRLILCPLLGFVLFSIFCFCMFFALMEHRRPVLVTSRVYKQRFVETGFMRAIFRPYPCAESGPMHVCGRIFLHFFASSYLHFYPVLFMFTLRVVARQQMIRRLGLTVPLALYWRRSKQQKLYKHDTETISKEIYAKF